jgi:hypothetical protein
MMRGDPQSVEDLKKKTDLPTVREFCRYTAVGLQL